jgi:uncharacterized protein YjbI with pentapeptide repeats
VVEHHYPPPPGPTRWTEDLDDADFHATGRNMKLDGVVFRRVRLRNQRLFAFGITESRFEECTFEGALAESGSLGARTRWNDPESPRTSFTVPAEPSVYRACRFDGVDLSGLQPDLARFEECTFSDCRIEKWFCFHAEFVGCSFPGTSLRETTFWGRDRDDARRVNEVRDNDFSGADLTWARFTGGIDLDEQRWPDAGFLILRDFHARLAAVRAQVERWNDRKRRKSALFRLDAMAFREGPEQRDLFVSGARLEAGHELEEELLGLLRRAPV